MAIIAVILSLPILYLLVRILLIYNKNFWVETECEILSFSTIKIGSTKLDPSEIDERQINYPQVNYRYYVNGKEIISNRITLDIVDRGYSPIEIQYHNFFQEIRDGHIKCYYLKFLPSLSVLINRKSYAENIFSLLLVYITVLLTSYIIIVYVY